MPNDRGKNGENTFRKNVPELGSNFTDGSKNFKVKTSQKQANQKILITICVQKVSNKFHSCETVPLLSSGSI
jgi:hypothetical protein